MTSVNNEPTAGAATPSMADEQRPTLIEPATEKDARGMGSTIVRPLLVTFNDDYDDAGLCTDGICTLPKGK